MNGDKMTAEESCRQVLKTIADACDQESLARADGYIIRYVKEETVLRDCGQDGACRTPPGCARHWEARNRELVCEIETLHANNSLTDRERLLTQRAEAAEAKLAAIDVCIGQFNRERWAAATLARSIMETLKL